MENKTLYRWVKASNDNLPPCNKKVQIRYGVNEEEMFGYLGLILELIGNGWENVEWLEELPPHSTESAKNIYKKLTAIQSEASLDIAQLTDNIGDQNTRDKIVERVSRLHNDVNLVVHADYATIMDEVPPDLQSQTHLYPNNY